jgi:DNA-binding protein HU-beta
VAKTPDTFRPPPPLTKARIAEHLAHKAGVTKSKAIEILDAFTQLAYKEAKNTFTVPGLGKIVLAQRKARLGRNPRTGQAIQIPAKRVVTFRVAKAAEDAILGKSASKGMK